MNAIYLSYCISCMPQSIPKVFSWTCGGIDHFDGQSRVALSFCGCLRPVGLCDLFPHHHIEAGAGLIAEYKASIIIISVGIDEEGSTKVHCIKLVISWEKTEENDGLIMPSLMVYYIQLNISGTYQQQCQGHSWLSEEALYPYGGPPS